jgi:hypothetical protein
MAYETMLLANAKKCVNKPKAGGAARPLYQEKRPVSRKQSRPQESLVDEEEPDRIPPPPSGTTKYCTKIVWICNIKASTRCYVT